MQAPKNSITKRIGFKRCFSGTCEVVPKTKRGKLSNIIRNVANMTFLEIKPLLKEKKTKMIKLAIVIISTAVPKILGPNKRVKTNNVIFLQIKLFF